MTPQDQWILQKERVLAWLRGGFAAVAILAIQLNPNRIAKYPTLSYLALGSFLFYSLVIIYLTRKEKSNTKTIGLATTALDLAWISIIVFSTEGSRTPFFAYYFFPIITASSRYGVKGSLIVSLIGVVLYGFIRFNFVWARPLGIDTLIVRSVYMVVLAYIFGFLSEFEKKQNQKLLALSKTAAEVATIDERRRIMHELHDGLLQSLATHILRLETCRKHFIESPKELHGELQAIENNTRDVMKEIRQFLAGEETRPFPPGMLIDKLKEDLRFLRDGLGLQVTLETEPEDLNLPEQLEQDLYYALREALMNITRHSQASRTDVSIVEKDHKFQANLVDDGVGFDVTDPRRRQGLGLTTMQDRIKKLGGELSVQSSPGKGTRVSFLVPL